MKNEIKKFGVFVDFGGGQKLMASYTDRNDAEECAMDYRDQDCEEFPAGNIEIKEGYEVVGLFQKNSLRSFLTKGELL